jgi:hypothetical protein
MFYLSPLKERPLGITNYITKTELFQVKNFIFNKYYKNQPEMNNQSYRLIKIRKIYQKSSITEENRLNAAATYLVGAVVMDDI